ncbi:MAG TPA: hypothetical protein VNA13_00945 [Xanthomonadales bacterium]|nr:hypothetical protein [Xanthomonadales bacterium]
MKKNLANFLIRYKLLIIPLVPLLFVFTVLVLVFSSGNDNTQNQFTLPSPTVTTNPPNQTQSNQETGREDEVEPEDVADAQREVLSDGNIKYTKLSTNPSRPEIIITNNGGYPLFKRLVLPPNNNLVLSGFTKLYGQAKWVFKGSKFYGLDMKTHIYENYGLALVIDPKTDKVLEQHTFYPMKVEEYIKKYGDDIPDQP